MFLFTTPTEPARPSAPVTPVVDAIRQGAARTGTSFDYLLSTARRESALDPDAKAPNSTATGLFQFIEQTWLSVVKQAGGAAGLGGAADAIGTRANGTLAVDDPAARQAILDLRKDPAVASVMAGVLTGQNRDSLASALGREPGPGELYAAHVLGARGAADLIRTAAQAPARTAAADFPDAAAANRGIFYDRAGRARSAAEVYAALGSTGAPAVPVVAPVAASVASPENATVSPPGSGLSGLFQTNRSGPVSDAVAKIWRVNNTGRSGAPAATAFFPRSDGGAAAAPESSGVLAGPAPGGNAAASAVASGPEAPSSDAEAAFGPPAPVPLPPRRPAAGRAQPASVATNLGQRS